MQREQEVKQPNTTKISYDADDPFNMCEMFGSDKNDSGISLHSTKASTKDLLSDLCKSAESKIDLESDDSDCLFSITKSVSIQSLMNNGVKKRPRLNGEQRKKRLRDQKRKKSTLGLKTNFHENEEDDDDEDVEDKEEKVKHFKVESSNDDEAKLTANRCKLENENLTENPFSVCLINEERPALFLVQILRIKTNECLYLIETGNYFVKLTIFVVYFVISKE